MRRPNPTRRKNIPRRGRKSLFIQAYYIQTYYNRRILPGSGIQLGRPAWEERKDVSFLCLAWLLNCIIRKVQSRGVAYAALRG
jgi:hypothetical protein